MDSRGLVRPLLLGTAAGLRSITPIGAVSWAATSGRWSFRRSQLYLLSRPEVERGLILLTAAEFVGDKLPVTPPRTTPPVWLFRIAVGALVGAASRLADKRPAAGGALVGGAAASVSTYAGYRLRMGLIEGLGLPNIVAGLAGDLAALGLSLLAVSQPPHRRRNALIRLLRPR